MAITQEMITRSTNSVDSSFQSAKTEAPMTLRTPISLVRCSATKLARPNKPRQEMIMARPAKIAARFPMRRSSENFWA